MREELGQYRGKCVETGNWVFGFYYAVGGFSYIHHAGDVDSSGKTQMVKVKVIPGTTAPLVRTFGGHKLYEGDIAHVWHEDEIYPGEDEEDLIETKRVCLLRWGGFNYPAYDFYQKRKTTCNKAGFFWDPVDDEFNSFSTDQWHYEVIGNIVDNPELLEVNEC